MAGEKLADLPADQPRHRPHRGQGGGLPVRALPGDRSGALAGDEVHRRSHGNRRGFRRRPSSSRSRARGSICRPSGTLFVSVKDSDKAMIVAPVRALIELGFTVDRDRRHRRLSARARASPSSGSTRSRRAGRISSTGSRTAASHLIFNTTEGWQSHKDSASIRASARDRRRSPISPPRPRARRWRGRSRSRGRTALKCARCRTIIPPPEHDPAQSSRRSGRCPRSVAPNEF